MIATIDLTGTNAVPENSTAVAMGLFDGVHLGHRAVISRAVSIAAEKSGTAPAVFTFETDTVTSKGSGGVECLITKDIKKEILSGLGVKYIYSPDFMNFKDLSAEEFIELVLCGKLSAKYVVCGEDFRFGKNAAGDAELLDRLCRKRGIETAVVPPVIGENGERISSTTVRELIKSGRIAEANRMLGCRYFMRLPVAYGNRIGRTIHFPTINQYLPEKHIIPKFGVYASFAEVNGRVYKGVTNIGVKPTVGGVSSPLAETYIMDFCGDLYGENVKLSLVEFIRPEVKFDNVELLKEQIEKDVKKALDILRDDA